MLIRELLLLSEAISITHITPHVRRTIYQTLTDSLAYELPRLRANVEKHKSDVDGGHGKQARLDISNIFYRQLLPALSQSIDQAIDALIPNTLTAVTFKRIGSAGQAPGTIIVIQTDLVEKLGNLVVNAIFESIWDNGPEYFDAIFSKEVLSDVAKRLPRNGEVDELVSYIANVVTHELVHVIQHKKQEHRLSTEYRSYLGSNDEFDTLHDIVHDQKYDRTTPEYARWNYLYRASPQEIAAFAHDIANVIIQRNDIDADYYIDDATMHELMSEIISEIKRYITPKDRQERKVFNRYVKRVYQELNAHIDRLSTDARTN